MRVLLREVVDLDKPINLSSLGLFEMLFVSVISQLRDTRIYKRRREKAATKEYKARAENEELLKSLILTHAHNELTLNQEMGKRGWKCTEAKLTIPRSYESTLMEILNHKDLISNRVSIAICDDDLVRSFDKLPIIISVKKKVLGSDLYEEVESRSADVTAVLQHRNGGNRY